MKTPIKLSALSIGAALLMFLWAPSASAFDGFDDGGGSGLPACAVCHADLANNGPDHGTHAALSNNDCGSCHDGGGPGFDNPPLANCVRCHGRDADAGGDDESAGVGRGLRQHHVIVGAAACGACHGDATGPAGVGEDVLPSFYLLALNGAGLDTCDGSEEQFPSNSVSLDNDGDGDTDAADSDCAVNTAPVANAGLDQTVNVGDTVTLDGSGSSDADSDPLTYSWALSVPGGSGAALSDATAVGPTFVPDVDGTYTATLIVNDGTDDSAPDDAVITAQVVVVNIPPVADAGLDQTVDVGDTVTLDGSGSTDADSDPLTYSWALSVPGGSGAVLSDTAAVGPTFVPDVDGTYTATLIVNDGTDDSAPDDAVITAQVVVVNNPPVANAGLDQNVDVGDTVNLNGGGSSDADGDALTYLWSLSAPGGSGATLSSTTAASPTFVADVAGDYVAQLIVNDGTEDSAADTATITASAVPVNNPPVANAGVDENVTVDDTVTLDGSGSTDADGDALTYLWSLSVPGGSGATLSDPTAVSPTFVADVAGDYVAQLIVNDSTEDSAADTATITASAVPVNNPPVADAGLDQSVLAGDTVTLDASGSSDADGDALTYSWSLSVPMGSGATLTDPTAIVQMFVADVDGDYVAQLIVNDGADDSVPDSVVIMAALPAANQPPVANAGPDQLVAIGMTVNLDGSGSSDPEADMLTFSWSLTTIPAGSGATLSDAAAVGPSFVADVIGDYVLQLIVNDGEFDSAPDTVMVMVVVAAPPVADPSGPYSGFTNEAVTFDGRGSSDPDGGTIQSWNWDFGDGSTGMGETATHIYGAIGTYDVLLTVTDDEGQTSTAAMTTATVQDRPVVKRKSGGGAISLTFVWLLGFAALLTRRRSIGLRHSVGETSGS